MRKKLGMVSKVMNLLLSQPPCLQTPPLNIKKNVSPRDDVDTLSSRRLLKNMIRSPPPLVEDTTMSLLEFHPGIALGFLGCRSKRDNPYTLHPTSPRPAWWRCAYCDKAFLRPLSQHVALDGRCPFCGKNPMISQKYTMLGAEEIQQLIHNSSVDETKIYNTVKKRSDGSENQKEEKNRKKSTKKQPKKK